MLADLCPNVGGTLSKCWRPFRPPNVGEQQKLESPLWVPVEWISSGHVARLLIGLLEYTVAFGIYSCSARRLPDYDISAFFLASIEGRRGAQ